MVSRQDLQLAQRNLGELYDRLRFIESQISHARLEQRRLRVSLSRIQSYHQLRTTLSNTLPPLVWSILAGAACFCVSFAVSVSLSLSQGLAIFTWLGSTFIGYGVVCLYFLEPSVQILHDKITRLSSILVEKEEVLAALVQQLQFVQGHYNKQSAICRQIRDEIERPKRILAARSWQQMQGIEFEQFLADVFRHLGYAVQTTKATGDHGVDLVAVRGDERFAIQAKGFPSGARVGNDAVLRVVGGMKVYQCNHTAVVTNSRFTSAALEAARHNNCILIDRHGIPKLIQGDIC